MRKRVLSFLLVLCLLTNLLVGFTALAVETVSTGTVHVDDALRVRSEPNTNCSTVGWLSNGDVVTIHEIVTAANGDRWYRISRGTLSGYAFAAYITINATYETDEEFEAYLTAQGFPEDYKPALRAIHAQYPNWIFRAEHLLMPQKTDSDPPKIEMVPMPWATALAEESEVGLNTIKSPDSWKSMEYGAYNWNTNAYVAYDSGGWVTASSAVIAYYMDPRNWLDSTYIFQFEDLTYSDKHTIAGIQAILPAALDKHAEDLLKASKEAKVNAYFLASRMAQEGSQSNGLGTGTVPGYEGYYNFFHIGAYAEYDKNGTLIIAAVPRGARTAKEYGWDTPYKALLGGAQFIGKGYINLGQDTLYYQKFNFTNTTSGLYAHQYMSNVAAPSSEGRIRRGSATNEELNSPLTFTIPVFKSMPSKAAPMPSKTGNNNNFLDSLTVEGQDSLSPTFDRYTMAYSLHVGETVNAVTVKAVLNNKEATIKGDGEISLKHGENVIPITVTATSGETRTYTLTVTREGEPTEDEEQPAPQPTITGTMYTVGSTVTKVEPETTVTDFIKNLAVTSGTAVVTNAAGEKKSGLVGTGDILQLYSGDKLHASYPIVIYGDVNGDGKISSVDILRMQKHIVGIITLEGYQLQAADVDKNNTVQPKDVLRGQKYIVDLLKTIQ